MKAFEVHVNGERVGMAGVGRNGFLAVIVNWVGGSTPRSRRGFDLRLGGLDSSLGESLDWETPAVGVGDEITIKIHETNRVDLPSERRPMVNESAESLFKHATSTEDSLVKTYERLIKEFPNSPEAKAAAEKRARLMEV